MVRSSHALAALVVLAILLGSGQLLEAQTKKKGETISGTVVSIEKAKTGRSYTMKMKTKSDETEYDVPLVPRTHLIVAATGDKGFLQANANVAGVLTALENPFEFECDELTVYVGNSPLPGLKPKADADNNPSGEFEMSGKIVELQAGVAQIQCGQQPIKLTFDASTVSVNVKFSDAALIKEGDVVDIEGTIVKGKQTINANAVTVTSAAPITFSDYSAAQSEQKGKMAKTASPKSKKESAATAASKEPDPFGVLGGQAKAKPKTKPKSGPTAPGLKESDPFAVLGGDAKAKSKKTTKTAPPPSVPALKDSDPFGLLKDKAKTKAKTGDNADAEKEEPAADKPGVKKAAKAAKNEEKTGTKE